MNRYWQGICVACALALGLSSALAEDINGPRTLPVNEGLMTIYPLQVEGMEGDTVRYRAALAYRDRVDAEPVFGAGWFESVVEIDRENRIVHSSDLRVRQVRFPEGTDDVQSALTAALAAQSTSWNLDRSLDDLEAALRTAATEQESLQNLNNAPPRIVYRDHPALLVTLDGEPLLREIENSTYQAVINTPYPLISDGRHFYLNVTKDVWYRADRAIGPYRFEASPPEGIAALVKPDQEQASAEAPAEPVTAANAPEIVVATQPTELIVTEGPAVFVPLVGDLLVLQNSDDDVFMHVDTQQFYVVLAGRWYHAGSLNGPWTYQAADQLPAAFADIPRSSSQADARVHIAGTAEAEEALLDAQVPQTAAVARGTADVEVSYDGEPDFRPVDGTDLKYAANTGAAVLQSDRRYYLVEDGVWYVSDQPNGPWQVSAWRPQAVARIAPTSPVYHVKYVYIYDSTPDVVYVGYTPGYLGSYVYRGTVVYGTGWYYRPWVSPYYYYPRPSTWGFHVSYNPWSGWGFGLSWNWGWSWDPFYTSYWTGGYWHRPYPWHHRHYGYWGPRGYRPRPAPYGHHRGGHDRYVQPHRGAGDNRYRGRHDNLYRDPGQRARVADTRDVYRRPQPGRGGGEPRERNRHERVTPADLRLKAQIRDVNQSAVSSMRVADKYGKVLRKTRRPPVTQSQAAPTRSVSAAKQLQAREQPGRQAVPPGDRHRVARQARGQVTRWPVKPATATPSRPPTVPGGSAQHRHPATDRAKASAANKPVYRVQPAPARTRTVPNQSQRASAHPQRQATAQPPPAAAPAQAPQQRPMSASRERPSVSQRMPKSSGRPDRGPRPGPNRERHRENQRRQ